MDLYCKCGFHHDLFCNFFWIIGQCSLWKRPVFTLLHWLFNCSSNLPLFQSTPLFPLSLQALSILSRGFFFFFFCASVPDEGAVGWRHVISAAALWLAADSHPTQLWLFSAEEALAPGMSSVLRNGAAAACVCVCVCFLSLSLSLYVCVGALTMVWTKQRADYCPCCEQEQGRFFIVVIEGAEWRGVEVSLWTRHWRRLENKVRWITVFFFFFYVSVTTSPICHPATVSLLLIVS